MVVAYTSSDFKKEKIPNGTSYCIGRVSTRPLYVLFPISVVVKEREKEKSIPSLFVLNRMRECSDADVVCEERRKSYQSTITTHLCEMAQGGHIGRFSIGLFSSQQKRILE